MFRVGDRVRVQRPHTTLDGAIGEVIRAERIPPRVGILGSHAPISNLYTVLLDDGTVVEPPPLVSDLVRVRGA